MTQIVTLSLFLFPTAVARDPAIDARALTELIEAAYTDMKDRAR